MSINFKSPFASTIAVAGLCPVPWPTVHVGIEKGVRRVNRSGSLEAFLLDKHPEGLYQVTIQAPV